MAGFAAGSRKERKGWSILAGGKSAPSLGEKGSLLKERNFYCKIQKADRGEIFKEHVLASSGNCPGGIYGEDKEPEGEKRRFLSFLPETSFKLRGRKREERRGRGTIAGVRRRKKGKEGSIGREAGKKGLVFRGQR